MNYETVFLRYILFNLEEGTRINFRERSARIYICFWNTILGAIKDLLILFLSLPARRFSTTLQYCLSYYSLEYIILSSLNETQKFLVMSYFIFITWSGMFDVTIIQKCGFKCSTKRKFRNSAKDINIKSHFYMSCLCKTI